MPPKLTDAEKRARGTFRPGRATAPRALEEIRAEIAREAEALELAEQEAGELYRAIRKQGTRLKTKDPRARAKTKLNPDVAARERALREVKAAKHRLELLREEESLALAAPPPVLIRPGLREMTPEQIQNADPPLNSDEELELLARDCGL